MSRQIVSSHAPVAARASRLLVLVAASGFVLAASDARAQSVPQAGDSPTKQTSSNPPAAAAPAPAAVAAAQPATGTSPAATAAPAATAQTGTTAAPAATGSTGAAAPAPRTAAVSRAPAGHGPIKEPVRPTACDVARNPGKRFYVEFRARTAVSYGHTFLLHGQIAGPGRFASVSVAGLHPAGNEASTYIAGHWAPVPAETGMSDGDLDEQFLTARYCVLLTEAEYRRVVGYIRKLQSEKTTWHAAGYNCNSFVGDVARFMGLRAPETGLIYPEVFVNSIKSMNTGGEQLPNIPTIQWGLGGGQRASEIR